MPEIIYTGNKETMHLFGETISAQEVKLVRNGCCSQKPALVGVCNNHLCLKHGDTVYAQPVNELGESFNMFEIDDTYERVKRPSAVSALESKPTPREKPLVSERGPWQFRPRDFENVLGVQSA